jgi:hypothetical protein
MLVGRPSPASFKTGLYVLEIGGNDYINALRSGLSPASINTTLLPQVIAKIVNATHVRNYPTCNTGLILYILNIAA